MKIWQVWDGDYDGDWVVASFDSEVVATDYAETYGLSRIQEEQVLSELPAEAADLTLRAGRAAERAKDGELARRQYQEGLERDRRASKQANALTIDKLHRPRLCHCRTFSSDGYFITSHGYCRYCGGWMPDVFRAAMGEAALIVAISELNIHQRRDMLAICGLPPAVDAAGQPSDLRPGTPNAHESSLSASPDSLVVPKKTEPPP